MATTPGATALGGLRVVDLTRVLAGPLCTQMLSDNGAQVVKIEPPGGDETRHLGPPYDAMGHSAYFAALNRGKKALALDLAQPEAQEVLHRLLADADVLVENFLPGTMEKWGLGYEQALAARYPRLVYCAISGFGRDGPLGGLPGYDAVLQAQCGLMSINGESASGATRMGIPIVDHLTGYVALTGILMALCSRQASGQGQRVEATLYDTALSLLLPHASNWFASHQAPGLLGSAHPNIAPYDKFRARDGHVFIGILNDGQFRRFSAHIGQPGLPGDARFRSNAERLAHRPALKAIIEAAIADADCEPLCEALMRVGVPAGVVNDVPRALAQAHCAHRGMVIQQEGFTALRAPMRLYGTPASPGAPPPGFSQHADEVLAGLGFNATERNDFYERGIARAHAPSSV
ncbi:crotonobetainyl-CoA:carnitine CoA-transferase CaiB-like acyl-CoA transferase [Acidovorax soli]|uniref:Crotonobetainyl-CoA:carnitine CoA-transferase CaiB-like acyl-CoA transferase n=1 Tax=Acidovorax soli TaxID=592050 RepID=A0A7X0PLU2_9BURK|nr:CoA transferase [Acidovorax soli]MBB6564189.1 crotonobetainyl-CoA:carnitine CoA-transferase CaiB-like acyl-CoA transferase [Acidovorax soli]